MKSSQALKDSGNRHLLDSSWILELPLKTSIIFCYILDSSGLYWPSLESSVLKEVELWRGMWHSPPTEFVNTLVDVVAPSSAPTPLGFAPSSTLTPTPPCSVPHPSTSPSIAYFLLIHWVSQAAPQVFHLPRVDPRILLEILVVTHPSLMRPIFIVTPK